MCGADAAASIKTRFNLKNEGTLMAFAVSRDPFEWSCVLCVTVICRKHSAPSSLCFEKESVCKTLKLHKHLTRKCAENVQCAETAYSFTRRAYLATVRNFPKKSNPHFLHIISSPKKGRGLITSCRYSRTCSVFTYPKITFSESC